MQSQFWRVCIGGDVYLSQECRKQSAKGSKCSSSGIPTLPRPSLLNGKILMRQSSFCLLSVICVMESGRPAVTENMRSSLQPTTCINLKEQRQKSQFWHMWIGGDVDLSHECSNKSARAVACQKNALFFFRDLRSSMGKF